MANEKSTNLITLEESRTIILKEVASMPVTAETYQAASNNLIRMRDFLKQADKLRTQDKEPYLRGGQEVDKVYAEAIKPVKEAELKLNNSIVTYKKAEYEAAQKEQARLDKLAEKQFEKAQANGTAVIPEPVSRLVDAPVKTVKSEVGTLSIKMVKVWRYANEKQKVLATSNIPQDFWKVDEQMIGKMVAAGIPMISGIVISEEPSTVARASRA